MSDTTDLALGVKIIEDLLELLKSMLYYMVI